MKNDETKNESKNSALEHYAACSYTPTESVGFLLARAKNAMAASLDNDLQALDITSAQWSILMRIANAPGKTAADLCRESCNDTGSMTRMLDRLEEKGFIERERSTEDRRVVELALTDLGREMYPKLLDVGVGMLNRHLRGFTAEEVQQFKDFLRRMTANGV